MSAMFWTLVFPASQIAVMTAMAVSMCKPERLRYSELPVWLWASLGGRETRARLRRVLASRERAAREDVRVRTDPGIEQRRSNGRPLTFDEASMAFQAQLNWLLGRVARRLGHQWLADGLHSVGNAYDARRKWFRSWGDGRLPWDE